MYDTGLFYHLLRLTAYLYNIEYVIVDMSPSGSMFNRAIFMSSDGFFMPSAVDPKVRGNSLACQHACASAQMHALKGLTHVLCHAVPPGI